MSQNSPPKVKIAHLPTPVHKLKRLIADAHAQEASLLITAGAVQSNHCRQTAGAAAQQGMDCLLVLEGYETSEKSGNVLLDLLFGVELVWARDRNLNEALQETDQLEKEAGRNPYLTPFGASTPIGSAGYVEAMGELLEQQLELDRIVILVTSGGTLGGFWLEKEFTALRVRSLLSELVPTMAACVKSWRDWCE